MAQTSSRTAYLAQRAIKCLQRRKEAAHKVAPRLIPRTLRGVLAKRAHVIAQPEGVGGQQHALVQRSNATALRIRQCGAFAAMAAGG